MLCRRWYEGRLLFELNFKDDYMKTWFTAKDKIYKCNVQALLDAGVARGDINRAELRFAIYYEYVIEQTSVVQTQVPELKECIEGSDLDDFIDLYSDPDIQQLIQNRFESKVNANRSSSSSFRSFSNANLTTENLKYHGEEETGIWESIRALKKIYRDMKITEGDPITIFGKICIAVVVEVFLGGVLAIIDAVEHLKNGEVLKGIGFLVYGVVDLAFTLFPATSWAKFTLIMGKLGIVLKSVISIGAGLFKTAATGVLKLLDEGATLVSKGGQLFVKNLCPSCVDIDFSFLCRLFGLGCFVEGTPVLMASNFNNVTDLNLFKISNAKSFAVAAAMPIVAIPIQDVQLLDYAVAHQTVNSTYGLTTSTDEDIYLGLIEDPYTSDQQRARDQYELDDENWNEVVFEEVHGTSTAKLALHHDWIKEKGYLVDGVINLNLPEQGINGPFKITSIRHILPQKKPTDEDETDEYDYRPVTALFTHESNQIYDISFDNGELIGVTSQHPIFSVSEGDWRMAGELEIGEKVLTKIGETTVIKSEKKEGSETVYNLEVKDLHNFLVGEKGIVVHNNYFDLVFKLLKMPLAAQQRVVDYAWGQGFPGWFKRGRFIEELLGQLRYAPQGWFWTGAISSNFPLIDFFKVVGNNTIVASVKSTKMTTVGSWVSANKTHLEKLNAAKILGRIQQNSSYILLDKIELHIVVPKSIFTSGMSATWKAKILADYPGIDDVIVNTVL